MTPEELALATQSIGVRVKRIQMKLQELKFRLQELDVPKYRASGIFDQFVLQVQQAINADDLYAALEAELSDTHLVWE